VEVLGAGVRLIAVEGAGAVARVPIVVVAWAAAADAVAGTPPVIR
jgi:hypothetical protein